jgi:hypothetical protein
MSHQLQRIRRKKEKPTKDVKNWIEEKTCL